MKNQLFTIIAAIILTAIILASCVPVGSNPDEYCEAADIKITQILDIIVDPETVIEGDTATITVVIEDSLLDGFTYKWGTSTINDCSIEWPDAIVDISSPCLTYSNNTRWIAPFITGDSTVSLSIDIWHDSLEALREVTPNCPSSRYFSIFEQYNIDLQDTSTSQPSIIF